MAKIARRIMPRTIASAVFLIASTSILAQDKQWPYSMDYGPYLMTTFEGGGLSGNTMKGVVVELTDGDKSAAVAFDTELLRLSAAWTDGWLRLKGTAYDGAHGPMVRLRGRKVAETAVGPGWARDGDLGDPRSIVDGPLPREWGQYTGLWLLGDEVIVGYRIGDMDVREGYGLEHDGRVITRTLELGPSAQEQVLVIQDGPKDTVAGIAEMNAPARFGMLQWTPKVDQLVEYDGTTIGWADLAMGGPSSGDYLDQKSGSGAVIAVVPGFGKPRGPAAGALHDGVGASSDEDQKQSVWFERQRVDGRNVDQGRYHVDLQAPVDVSRISAFSWHEGNRAIQRYTVYGTAEPAPDLAAKVPVDAGWTEIARVDSGPLGEGDKHGTSIHRAEGLGKFRHLLIHMRRGGAYVSEIDVFADKLRADVDAVGRSRHNLVCAVRGDDGPEIEVADNRMVLRIPAHDVPMRVQLAMTAGDEQHLAALGETLMADVDVPPLPIEAADARWGDPIVTKGALGDADGAFAVDTITIPFDNRFGSRMRTGAFDFFSDNRAAVSTWNGDVWIVEGIDADLDELKWTRFATGLFDPLGLRIVDDVIYVHGRDGLTRLHDTDGNGEADFYECFNNMVYITHAFHEYAFDLQTDKAGNFYFSKGAPVNPGGRGFQRIAPHHGTILKVSKDGSAISVMASGMRAPNGIGVHDGPHGTVFTSGDNEGTYIPKCRLNWFYEPGYYAGVKDTAQRTPVPDQPDLPLCWMPMNIDNSGGGQVMVTGRRWADLDGRILHCSYGTCSLYLVLPEWPHDHEGPVQGGVVRLPVDFSSSCMRPRFSPVDGELYVIGLKGWQTSAAREGGFHRVRRTGAALDVPTGLKTCKDGVYLSFTEPLDAEFAEDPENYSVEIWNYIYSQNYGSPELSVLQPDRRVEQGKKNRDPLAVTAAKLGPDKRTVFLTVEGMQPAHQMRITWNVDSAAGGQLKGQLHNSIHALRANPGF